MRGLEANWKESLIQLKESISIWLTPGRKSATRGQRLYHLEIDG